MEFRIRWLTGLEFRCVLELYTPERLWAVVAKDPPEVHQWMYALQLVQEKCIKDFDDLLAVMEDIGSLQECPEVGRVIKRYCFSNWMVIIGN